MLGFVVMVAAFVICWLWLIALLIENHRLRRQLTRHELLVSKNALPDVLDRPPPDRIKLLGWSVERQALLDALEDSK